MSPGLTSNFLSTFSCVSVKSLHSTPPPDCGCERGGGGDSGASPSLRASASSLPSEASRRSSYWKTFPSLWSLVPVWTPLHPHTVTHTPLLSLRLYARASLCAKAVDPRVECSSVRTHGWRVPLEPSRGGSEPQLHGGTRPVVVRGRRGHRTLRGALRDDLRVYSDHRRGSAGQHHAGEDLHHQQRYEERAQHLHLQPGGGRPATAGHLRARGRLPLLLRGVGVRRGGVQTHPRHPAHLGRGVGVHAHCAQRWQVGESRGPKSQSYSVFSRWRCDTSSATLVFYGTAWNCENSMIQIWSSF